MATNSPGRTNQQQQRQLLKLLITGEAGVGKTSLLLRYSEPSWDPRATEAPTLGVDNKTMDVTVGGRDMRLQMWDTAGQEKFRVITSTFYKGAHGVIAAFDVTARESFDAVTGWFKEADTFCTTHVAKVLVGNKGDLPQTERVVTREEATALAASLGNVPYFETSVFDAQAVRAAFDKLAMCSFEIADAHAQQARQVQAREAQQAAIKPGTAFKIDRRDPTKPKKGHKCSML